MTAAHSAAVYVRISQDRGGAGLGVERQETECRALAERLGWTVVEVYCDNDMSAFTGKRRERYEDLLSDLEAGKVTAVIAWHPDRLHRRLTELSRYIDLCKERGIENQTVTAGQWDLSTAAGRMMARTMGNGAEYESDQKSERLKSARIQHAKQGRHHGGIRCYGYQKDGMTVIPGEAAEIVSACKLVAEGASLRSIVADMNQRRVPTATGKIGAWTSQQLRQTLMSPRIAGYSTHKGVIVGTAAWPAIVADEALWRNVEKILGDDNRQTNGGGNAPRWLGSGLYLCACGARSMRASVTGGSKRYTYRCANSHDKSSAHVTRDAVALDAFVEQLIIERLSRPGTIEALTRHDDTVDVTALRVELAAIGADKDKAAALFADGTLDAGQLATITRRHNQRAATIADTLARAGWRSPLDALAAGDIAAAWAQLPLASRRAILQVVADVHVLPTKPTTRGFDPAGVRIDWKVG
jgi:DNA invertase Pin-like site-specific DNA recombinase